MTKFLSEITARFCFLLFIFILYPAKHTAAADLDKSGFVPTGALVEDVTESLPLSPMRVVVLDKDTYVVGTKETEGSTTEDLKSQILHLDSTTMEILKTLDLPFLPHDVAISYNSNFVYLIGNSNDTTELLILDMTLERLGSVAVQYVVAYPTLSEAENDVLVVGGMSTSKVGGALFAIDVSNPRKPTAFPNLLPDDYNFFGVTGAWLDNRYEDKTVFLNIGQLPTLVAFGIGAKGIKEYADISFGEEDRTIEPLKTRAFLPGRLCGSDEREQQASFLISSIRNSSLFLVIFDPDFESLDIVAKSKVSLEFPEKIDWPTYNASEVKLPSSLLASSCDQGVIWVGNVHSKEIEQFAVNTGLQSLEKIGQISMKNPPKDIAISMAGHVAFVISSNQNTISRFTSSGNAVSGTEAERELQRLLTESGYSVGTIDGQIGIRTFNAVKRFETRNKVKLDIIGNLPGAIEMIKKISVERSKQ